ncbi:glycosyl hydrolase family protein [Histomonas meleagridis]|uniref:glycosyl hydrolase family protein n=1 Tax=Histomonas meleagridis TaxID=135588 RepID=UPI00355A81DD|nr:glycosyl hydrolase family protein [Histomonas meleagridis]KAH0802268.1 glycosyl hydrolase family protein [Histomonas meleagridis]
MGNNKLESKKLLFIVLGIVVVLIIIVVVIVVVVTSGDGPSERLYRYTEKKVVGNGGGGVLRYGVISPHDSNQMAVTSDMGGFYYSHNGGESWNFHGIIGTTGRISYHPKLPGVLYATSSGIFKSYNNGDTLEMIYPPQECIEKHNAKYEYNVYLMYMNESCDNTYNTGSFCKAIAIDSNNEKHILTLWKNGDMVWVKETYDEFKTIVNLKEMQISIDTFKAFYSSITNKFYFVLDNAIYDATKPENPILELDTLVDVNQLEDQTFIIITSEYYNTLITGKLYSTTDFNELTPIDNNILNQLDLTYNEKQTNINLKFSAGKSLNEFVIATDGKYDGYDVVTMIKVNSVDKTAKLLLHSFNASNQVTPYGWVERSGCILTPYSLEYNSNEYLLGALMGLYKVTEDDKVLNLHSRSISDTIDQTTGLNEVTTYFVRTDPFDSNHLFMPVTDFNLIESFDGGETWSKSDSGIPREYKNTVYDLLFHPTQKDVIYIVAQTLHDLPYTFNSYDLENSKGGFGVSKDGGKTFDFNNNLPQNVVPLRIAIDFTNENEPTIYLATFKDGFYRSKDGGKTFENINNGIIRDDGNYVPATDILVKDSRVFGLAGVFIEGNELHTKARIYELINDQWKQIETPNFKSIRSIAYDETTKRLYAGVMGEYNNWPEREHINCGIFYYNENNKTWLQVESDGKQLPVFGVTIEKGKIMGTMIPGTVFQVKNGKIEILMENLFHGLKHVSFTPNDNVVYVSSFGGGTARVTMKEGNEGELGGMDTTHQGSRFYYTGNDRYLIDHLIGAIDKLSRNNFENGQFIAFPTQPQFMIPEQQVIVNNIQKPQNYGVNQAIYDLARQPMSAEKERVRLKLIGFDQNTSEAWNYISKNFGQDVKQHCLCEMAKYLSLKRSIPLDRDSKRRKSVLIKWFHDNWPLIAQDMQKFRIQNDELIIEDTDDQ